MKHVILIPTYNESENIEKIISVIFGLYPHVYIKVIDDNSPDGTGKIVERLSKSYQHLSLLRREKKEGLGKAYIHGFKEVIKDDSFSHLIMMDADMSHNPKFLSPMITKSSEYDLVVGSRYVKGGKTVGWEAWRRALSYFGNLYARLVLRSRIHDLTGGFNCIQVSALKKIDMNSFDSSGYAFQIELKYLLQKSGAKVAETPIIFANRTGGESKISNHIISEGLLAPWKMIIRKTYIPIPCQWCDAKKVKYFSSKNGHTLYVCSKCKIIFVHPIPEEVSIYDSSYFSGGDKGFGYVDYDTDKEPMRRTFKKYLDYLEKYKRTKGKLLDVGAATGFFLGIAKERGFEVEGVEISSYAAEQGRKKGFDIKIGTLEEVLLPSSSFDVVTLFDVVEHVSNPKNFLLETKRVLKKGGFLIINTPDTQSGVAMIFGTKWHLLVPPEHLYYFSPINLGRFLVRNGFSVKMNKSIGKRFTFEYIFKTLYKWQKISLWNSLASLFSKSPLSKLYIPLNTHDNFFMIAQKIND